MRDRRRPTEDAVLIFQPKFDAIASSLARRRRSEVSKVALSAEKTHTVPKEFGDLLARAPVSARAKSELKASMEAAGRFYHTTAHLAQLWRRHRRYAAVEGFDVPAIEMLIACAIAYHDSIYDMTRRDNEDRSADFWLAACAQINLSMADKLWVAETIRATKDHLGYHPTVDVEHPDRADVWALKERARVWVLDLDLSPLGDLEANFDHNTACLRREAEKIPDPDWRQGQRKFLSHLLAAPRIFRTPVLFGLYEAPARRNIERLLARLDR